MSDGENPCEARGSKLTVAANPAENWEESDKIVGSLSRLGKHRGVKQTTYKASGVLSKIKKPIFRGDDRRPLLWISYDPLSQMLHPFRRHGGRSVAGNNGRPEYKGRSKRAYLSQVG